MVPATALLALESGIFVYAVRPGDATVERRAVEIGFDDGIEVEIVKGLEQSDLVILSGRDLVSEGSKVAIVPAQPH